MKKRVIDYIKLKNHTDASINSSALVGLRRYNKILKNSIKFVLLLGGTFLGLTKIREIYETINNGKTAIHNKIENNTRIESNFRKSHQNLVLEYIDNKDFNKKEELTGIFDARFKLINKWAQGCGSFRNAKFYDKNKVKMIIACDWIDEMLEFANLFNNLENVRLVNMDCCNLEYNNNSFDTVVDTFGLQASYDYKMQYEEMKRVCKVGGKIILLEIGESLWTYVNYRTVKNAEEELQERGQILFRNYDSLVMNDPDVKVLYRKRKINGRLFMYVLEKI